MNAQPTTRFLKRQDGRRLAYAVHGEGPALVCPAWWVSHLEDDWKQESFRALFGGLARHHTVVRYDRPGAGLSDRERDEVELESEVATLSALVDHLGLSRFHVFAVSCAGPPTLAYAAAHRERIERLVFFGSFLRGKDVGPASVKEAMQSLVRAHWGIGSRTITNLFAPDLAGPEVEQISRGNRRAASPEMAARLLALSFDVDAAAVASAVEAPALVIHRADDKTVRYEAGRELAAALPNADLLRLDGNAHVPWLGEVEPVVRAVLDFLGNAPQQAASRPHAASDGENRLRREGDVWAVTFDGSTVHVKAARGMDDLALLLGAPGREIHVAELWSGEAGASAATAGADAVLDERALQAYRARLQEIEQAVGEAETRGDAATAEQLEQERQALLGQLRSAVGLGGRARRLDDSSERARKAVSSRIRASIKKIAEVHPSLGRHLQATVRTGLSCCYQASDESAWSVE